MAVFCPCTLRHHIHPVPIPLRLDNSFTVELYTARVALTARGGSGEPTFAHRTNAWHFADC